MTSFMIIELVALVGPVSALVLVPRLSPEHRRPLVGWSALWLAVFGVGGWLGLRLTPAPLGAGALALAILACWVIVFALRPERGGRVVRRLYWLMIGVAFLLNYVAATRAVLGIGRGAEGAEPEVRERLASDVVAYAFRVSGTTLDFRGYDVEVRRTLPWIGFMERVAGERSYFTTDVARLTAPTFQLGGGPDARAVLVTLGDWVGDAYPSPDTIRLE